ncbi:hypothetical protein B0H17DRAFT_600191 [Mycena rosella]|uniref:Uncharacterized protein n=1 Tax=Mycena rosella TaxID=1033263 RepID=A0AAD7GIU4_MYCRO|nr:hypothetical protein B0H17DRAFT_600191 [Mycena rosella]
MATPPTASQRGERSPFRPFKPSLSSSSDTDWLTTLIFNARAIAAGMEALPFPYVKGVFGTAVFLLETVEKVERNRESMKELCADTVDIITVVRDQIISHRDTAAIQFKTQCAELEREVIRSCRQLLANSIIPSSFLQDVVEALSHRQRRPRGFGAIVKEVLKSNNTTDEIGRWRNRICNVRSNFMLMATMDTNFKVDKVLTVISPNVPSPEAPQHINNCPPATRIFHGRHAILQKMHQYFNKEAGKQHIFLLHGLGGSGKTQISLRFIEESVST